MAETFLFAFDGEGVRDGSMDVRDFAPAALAVGQLVEQANRVLNGGRADVSVRLKADFRTGSFESAVEIGVSLYEQAKAIFDGELKDARELIEALGFWGNSALGGGLLGLLKKLKGRKPKKGTVLENGRVALELPDGEVIEASRDVADLYNDIRVLQATREVVKPVEQRDDIDDVAFSKPGSTPAEATRIQKVDIPVIVEPVERLDQAETIHSATYERVYSVVSPAFTGDYVWRLTDGDSKVSATMRDADFLARVERGDIAFSAGSLIQAEVSSSTSRTPTGKLSTQTEIRRVSKVIPPAKQTLLQFDAQDVSTSSIDQT